MHVKMKNNSEIHETWWYENHDIVANRQSQSQTQYDTTYVESSHRRVLYTTFSQWKLVWVYMHPYARLCLDCGCFQRVFWHNLIVTVTVVVILNLMSWLSYNQVYLHTLLIVLFYLHFFRLTDKMNILYQCNVNEVLCPLSPSTVDQRFPDFFEL